jgi:hydrogenase nickel incorporation protein HypB
MCSVCGCGQGETRIEGHHHDHHDHHHGHGPDHGDTRLVEIEQDILSKNDGYAALNRRRLAALDTLALNLVSSPGAGKTTLLTATLARLIEQRPVAVIEGDQATANDADRIRQAGAPAVQINTGSGCHLDAHMVGHALDELAPAPGGVLFIENVGNLVCPAAFDLGEAHKVAILSVTEGDDKPIKYPDMFAAADLMVLSKVDLLPHVDFDIAACIDHARAVNPAIDVMQVSAKTGAGMDDWLDWIGRCTS